MGWLEQLASLIDAFNGFIGRIVSWAVLPVALVAFAVVAMRYTMGTGYPWLQESYIWLHGAAVLLVSAWVLQNGGHVRVDLFYKSASAKRKAWIDLIGVIFFLLPMMGFLGWWSIPLVERSWRLMERSPTNDGLTFVYLMKTVIPVFCVLVMLQGLAMLLRSVATIVRGEKADG
jgi:TRAP-type mannitol/chloroaromatic compound transport system permease small subunit